MEEIAALGISVRSTDAEQAAKNLDKMEKSGRKAEKATDRLERKWKSLSKHTATLRGGFDKLTRQVLSLKTAVAALIVGFVFNRAIKQAKEFETALVDMGKVTTRNLTQIRREVMALDPALGSATELMKGYYQTISAGVTDPAKAMATLTTAAKASKAAHIDQSETIKALTKIMAGFGGEIRSVTEASDLLFTIERLGQTSFAELVPVIGDVAAISHTLGVNTREMGAALATVTQTAGSTAEAATQYKGVLMGLYKPNESMIEAFKNMGVTSGKAAVEQYGLAGAIQEVTKYSEESGESLGKFFRTAEGLLAIAALSNKEFGAYKNNLNEMGSAAGATERAYAAWGETLEAVSDTYKNTMGKVLIELGTTFGPAFRTALTISADALQVLLDKMKDLKEQGKLDLWAQRMAVGMIGAFRGVLEVINTIAEAITGVQAIMAKLSLTKNQLQAKALNDFIETIKDGIADVKKELEEGPSGIDKFIVGDKGSTSYLGWEVSKRNELIKLEEKLGGLMKERSELLEEAGENANDLVKYAERFEAINKLYESAVETLNEMEEAAKNAKKAVQEISEPDWDWSDAFWRGDDGGISTEGVKSSISDYREMLATVSAIVSAGGEGPLEQLAVQQAKINDLFDEFAEDVKPDLLATFEDLRKAYLGFAENAFWADQYTQVEKLSDAITKFHMVGASFGDQAKFEYFKTLEKDIEEFLQWLDNLKRAGVALDDVFGTDKANKIRALADALRDITDASKKANIASIFEEARDALNEYIQPATYAEVKQKALNAEIAKIDAILRTAIVALSTYGEEGKKAAEVLRNLADRAKENAKANAALADSYNPLVERVTSLGSAFVNINRQSSAFSESYLEHHRSEIESLIRQYDEWGRRGELSTKFNEQDLRKLSDFVTTMRELLSGLDTKKMEKIYTDAASAIDKLKVPTEGAKNIQKDLNERIEKMTYVLNEAIAALAPYGDKALGVVAKLEALRVAIDGAREAVPKLDEELNELYRFLMSWQEGSGVSALETLVNNINAGRVEIDKIKDPLRSLKNIYDQLYRESKVSSFAPGESREIAVVQAQIDELARAAWNAGFWFEDLGINIEAMKQHFAGLISDKYINQLTQDFDKLWESLEKQDQLSALTGEDRDIAIIRQKYDAWRELYKGIGDSAEILAKFEQKEIDIIKRSNELKEVFKNVAEEADAWGQWADLPKPGDMDDAIEDLRKLEEAFNSMKESLEFEIVTSGFKGWDKELAQIQERFRKLRQQFDGVDDIQALDALEAQLIAIRREIYESEQATKEWDSVWKNIGDNMQRTFETVLYDFVSGNKTAAETITDIWKRAFTNIAAEWMTRVVKEMVQGVSAKVSTTTPEGESTASNTGFLRGIFAKLPWFGGSDTSGKTTSATSGNAWPTYEGGPDPLLGGPSGSAAVGSTKPKGAWAGSGYLAAGALGSSFIDSSWGGGAGGMLQGGLSGASMGSMGGPWGALIGGIIGSMYGGYQSGFYSSGIGKTNAWSSILTGTPFVPFIDEIFNLPGIGGDEQEPANIATSISDGAWDIARHGDQEDISWSVGITRGIKKSILDFGEEFEDMFQEGFNFDEWLSNLDWSFQATDVDTWAGAVNETLANFIVDNWEDLFGTASFLNVDELGIGMKGEGNIFEKWQREGEEWSDTVIRMVETLLAWKQTMENIDLAIEDILVEDTSGIRAFQKTMDAYDESISNLQDTVNEFANESWERLDFTDAQEAADALMTQIVERYETEKKYIEDLVAQIQSIDKAMYDFQVRLQGKIDELTGSYGTIDIVIDRLRTLWAEFQTGPDFERAVVILDELEAGLDTALSLQVEVHEEEIARLEEVLAMLEQLKDVNASLTEKILGGTQGYAEQVAYYWSQAMETFREYSQMNWDQPETLADRINAVNTMIAWLDKTVEASINRWSAYWDEQIETANDSIDLWEEEKERLQENIRLKQEEYDLQKESYETQIDAIQEQIQAAEEWQRLAESIEDQMRDMRLSTDNQRDVFERMHYARSEIAQVQALYAGATTDEDKIKYAGQLQDLYRDLLNLGQEAYQRPSDEYLSVYEEVMSGLQSLGSDATANSQSLESLQAEEIRLTEEMNTTLQGIEDYITRMEYEIDNRIDPAIEGLRDDIEYFEDEKKKSLDLIQTEAAQYYTWLQGEVQNLLLQEAAIESELKSEKQALNDLYLDFGAMYADLKNAGSDIYTAQQQTYVSALREVIGDGTVNGYLSTLRNETVAGLQHLIGTMDGIAGYMINGITPEVAVPYVEANPPGYDNIDSSFGSGGIAWTPQISRLAEHEPEVIIPFSDLPGFASSGGEETITIQVGEIRVPITFHIDAGSGSSAEDIAEAVKHTVEHECTEIIQAAVAKGIKNGALRDPVKRAAQGR